MTSNKGDSNSKSRANDDEYFIKIEGPERCEKCDDFKLSGEFNVLYEKNGITAQGAKVLKHIALVVTRSGNYQAVAPFEEVVVFEDDVKEEKEGCSGYFNIKVMDHIVFDGEGDYYVLCSLGAYLSNTIKVTI